MKDTTAEERNIERACKIIENLMVTIEEVDEKTGKVTRITVPAYIKQPNGSYKKNELLL